MGLQKYKNELFLFAVAVFVPLLIFISVYERFGDKALYWGGLDTAQYHILAENFLQGHGFSLKTEPPFTPSATRTPGYPFLLAASKYMTGNSIPIILLQILAFAGIVLLTYRMGIMMLGDNRRAWWAAIMLLAELQTLYFALLVMSDIIFIFLLTLSLWLLFRFLYTPRPHLYLMAAFLLGFATLVRPGGILLVFLYAPFSFFAFKKIFSLSQSGIFALAGIAVFLLPVAPWSLRNERAFGTYRLTAADTYNLYFFPSKRIMAIINGTTLLEERARFTEHLAREAGCTDFEAYDTFKCAPWMEREAWRIIRAHPFLLLRVIAASLPDHLTAADWVDPFVRWGILKPAVPEEHRSLLRVGVDRNWPEVFRQIALRVECGANCVASSLLLMFGRITWALMSILATVGAITLWQQKEIRAIVSFSCIVVAYIIGVNSFFLTYFDVAERFRLPIFPFLFIFAVAGWVMTRNRLLRRELTI